MPGTVLRTSHTTSKRTYKEGPVVIPILRGKNQGAERFNSYNCTLGLNLGMPTSRASVFHHILIIIMYLV